MIAILDFGSQTCELIARRVRELEVYSEVLSYDIPASVIKEKGVEGIILSGGPSSCYEEGSPLPDPEIFKLGIPILGICYGMQLSQQMLGGKVEADGSTREYGKARFKANTKSLLFTGLLEDFVAWMSHGDSVTKLAPGFEVIGPPANEDGLPLNEESDDSIDSLLEPSDFKENKEEPDMIAEKALGNDTAAADKVIGDFIYDVTMKRSARRGRAI
jgi:GMP synthase (glutamine-hydrolysing) A subunit